MYSVDHVGRLPWRRHFSFGPRHFQDSTAHFLLQLRFIAVCLFHSRTFAEGQHCLCLSLLRELQGEQLQFAGALAVLDRPPSFAPQFAGALAVLTVQRHSPPYEKTTVGCGVVGGLTVHRRSPPIG
jgi:hypothetical protein